MTTLTPQQAVPPEPAEAPDAPRSCCGASASASGGGASGEAISCDASTCE